MGASAARQPRRPRVLIADDYVALHAALTRLLGPACEVVGHVSNGADLIDTARRVDADVVLLDLRLPDIDGLEACRQLRTALPHLRIIVFTASDSAELRRKALAAGACGFVPKLRAGDDLVAAIHQAVQR